MCNGPGKGNDAITTEDRHHRSYIQCSQLIQKSSASSSDYWAELSARTVGATSKNCANLLATREENDTRRIGITCIVSVLR